MTPSRVFRFFAAASTLLLTTAACNGIERSTGPGSLPRYSIEAGELFQCSWGDWQTTSGYIGPEGGTLYVPGASVSFPEGALVEKTLIVFSVGPEGPDAIAAAVYPHGDGAASLDRPAALTIDPPPCSVGEEPTGVRDVSQSVGALVMSDTATTEMPPDSEPAAHPRIIVSIVTFAWYIIAE